MHVGVGLAIQWPWEAYRQNHNSAGFLADIWLFLSDNVWYQLEAVEL
jgi:hypothetical protein